VNQGKNKDGDAQHGEECPDQPFYYIFLHVSSIKRFAGRTQGHS
jgi:hypothetical protein